MWIYTFKALTIIASVFVLKLILEAEGIDETRIYLIALAVAGAMSLLEFGLGDHLLQRARAGEANKCATSKVNKLLLKLLVASLLFIGIIIFNSQSISLEDLFVLSGIFLYSIVNIILGIHLKLSFVMCDLKKSYMYFSAIGLVLFLSALIGKISFDSRFFAMLILLYGNFILVFFAMKDFLRFNAFVARDKLTKLSIIKRSNLSLENALNSITLMLVGIVIAALPSKEEVALFSIYSRIVNVVAMLGMIYVLKIWEGNRNESTKSLVARYMLFSFLLVVILSAIEFKWIYMFLVDFESQILLSLSIALPLIFWRIIGDLVSQISKLKMISGVVISNAIIQFVVMSSALGASYSEFYNINFLIGLFVVGGIISGAFLMYVMSKKEDPIE